MAGAWTKSETPMSAECSVEARSSAAATRPLMQEKQSVLTLCDSRVGMSKSCAKFTALVLQQALDCYQVSEMA